MINNNMYIGGPKSLGGMYDWDIITEILNAKYPEGIKFSDETAASKEFTKALNKVQTDMVAKSNKFEERIAALGDSAALKGFVDLYKNPTSVVPVLATIKMDNSKIYTTTSKGVLTNVNELGKKALLDDKTVDIALQYKYSHPTDNAYKWIYGVKTNAMIAFIKIGARDTTTTPSEYDLGFQKPGYINFKGDDEDKKYQFSSDQMYTYNSNPSRLMKSTPLGYFRANEQLVVDAKTSSKYGVDVSDYIGKPYAEVNLLTTGEKVIVVFGG